jgi:hypothetical protein
LQEKQIEIMARMKLADKAQQDATRKGSWSRKPRRNGYIYIRVFNSRSVRLPEADIGEK